MKFNRRRGISIAVVASLGMGTAVTVALAADAGDAASTAGARHFNHPVIGPIPDSPLVRTTLHATRHLNLTTAQQSQIRTILQNAHAQAKASHSPADVAVLGNPSDPHYATALQSLKTEEANRIQQESDLQGQIVNVLTPEQKQKLPGVLASMQTQHAERHAAAGHHTDTMR